jgi:IclR family KDG regulon transcriptional repressor
MEANDVDQQNTIKAVNRALRVIELLREMDGARVSEIADRLGWAKSTTHSHLQTLEQNEYITREGDEYVLGFRFVELGEYVNSRKEVYSLVEPKIAELADKTGERVQFIVHEHHNAVYARIAEGERSVSTGGRLGRRRTMLHASAAGKAILAKLPEKEMRSILNRTGLPQSTPNTITDEDELFEELEDIRDRGYAFNYEEHIKGLRAIATSVESPVGEVLGAISIAGPAHRMQGEWFNEELPDMILGVSNEIELNIAYR